MIAGWPAHIQRYVANPPRPVVDLRKCYKWLDVVIYSPAMRKPEVPDFGCVEWSGYKTPSGYGYAWQPDKRRAEYAHRTSWEKWRGPIPDGMEIDHLCRNRACVNPRHLRVVTHKENTLCSDGPAAVNARKTHCPAGHEYTHHVGGGRRCRTCINQRQNDRRQSRRQQDG